MPGPALGWLIVAVIALTPSAVAVRAEPLPAMPAFADLSDAASITDVAFRNAVPFPAWTAYALTDALFWGRDNQAGHRPLLVTVGDETPLLSASDLQFPFSEGVRSFYGQRNPDAGGWEIGYFGVYGQSASRTVASPAGDFLQLPEPLGGVFTSEADAATVKYSSLVNSAEANVFSTATDWRDRCGGWLTVDWLAGFRYVGVEEQSSIAIDACAGDPDCADRVAYRVRSRNNMFGGQLGTRGRMTWRNWAVEGWAKAGLLGNAQKEIQSPLVTSSGAPLDRIRSATGSEVGFIGDINLSLVYRLTDVWGIRAGYNTVWISGVALAPNQFDFTLDEAAGGRLDPSGGMFLHGANLGLEARW
ncbi:MAG: BBP7 family outer membrane beta-barrel protein [Planctomycetia bacterium]|nr:BBP7 family outer membrane beta-barrel protein [Planctomycetia bacterium]